MATECIAQRRFKFDKEMVAKFDAEHASAVLLTAIDRQLGVPATVAGCLRDRRQRGKVQDDVLELVRQRIFGLVCGYADCNDAARLADDAVHKLVLDRIQRGALPSRRHVPPCLASVASTDVSTCRGAHGTAFPSQLIVFTHNAG